MKMEYCVISPKLASDAQRERYTQLFPRATHFSFQILRGELKQGQSVSTNHKYTCDKRLMMKICAHDAGIIGHADDQLTYNGFVVLDCAVQTCNTMSACLGEALHG